MSKTGERTSLWSHIQKNAKDSEKFKIQLTHEDVWYKRFFIFYVKHVTSKCVKTHEVSLSLIWNMSRGSTCDDLLYMCSYTHKLPVSRVHLTSKNFMLQDNKQIRVNFIFERADTHKSILISDVKLTPRINFFAQLHSDILPETIECLLKLWERTQVESYFITTFVLNKKTNKQKKLIYLYYIFFLSVHGSSVSLVSTASSLYSSAEEKQAHELRKLRRELIDAQEKVHSLTSQLSTNVSVPCVLLISIEDVGNFCFWYT